MRAATTNGFGRVQGQRHEFLSRGPKIQGVWVTKSLDLGDYHSCRRSMPWFRAAGPSPLARRRPCMVVTLFGKYVLFTHVSIFAVLYLEYLYRSSFSSLGSVASHQRYASIVWTVRTGSVLPSVDTMTYLGIYLFGTNMLSVPPITPNAPSVGCQLCFFGKIGRITAEESVLRRIKGKLVQILFV